MKICSAPSSRADSRAISPTGPAPKMATLEPWPISRVDGRLVAGGQDVGEEQHLLVASAPSGTLSGPTLAFGTRTNSACPPA